MTHMTIQAMNLPPRAMVSEPVVQTGSNPALAAVDLRYCGKIVGGWEFDEVNKCSVFEFLVAIQIPNQFPNYSRITLTQVSCKLAVRYQLQSIRYLDDTRMETISEWTQRQRDLLRLERDEEQSQVADAIAQLSAQVISKSREACDQVCVELCDRSTSTFSFES